jgi:uncharacterized lipoprotein YehR (DUF1307 family)
MAAARLSEAELIALRDFAGTQMLERAGERLRDFDADECQRETVAMLASGEVYGALRNVEGAFNTVSGETNMAPESVDLDFTTAAMDWLQKLRGEVRDGLEDGRGTIESNENTADETYLLYILDGICDRGEA